MREGETSDGKVDSVRREGESVREGEISEGKKWELVGGGGISLGTESQ